MKKTKDAGAAASGREVELELTPALAEAVARYARDRGVTMEDATAELVRIGMEAFQRLTPEEKRAGVARWKSAAEAKTRRKAPAKPSGAE
ncbi:MAG: hypothetical protein IKQ15_08345 [Kiritimatiellae bacterium]|nr:hypothetical protein [Kiritimatiellia bacterium]